MITSSTPGCPKIDVSYSFLHAARRVSVTMSNIMKMKWSKFFELKRIEFLSLFDVSEQIGFLSYRSHKSINGRYRIFILFKQWIVHVSMSFKRTSSRKKIEIKFRFMLKLIFFYINLSRWLLSKHLVRCHQYNACMIMESKHNFSPKNVNKI